MAIAYNTDEWWTLDGVSLHQYGWSVTTFGGSRYDLPPRRGENIDVAYRPGKVWRPKLADQRTITLTMFLVGNGRILVPEPDDGNLVGRDGNINAFTVPKTADHRQRFNDSWDFLRRLVWRPNGTRVALGRRWSLTSAFTANTWGPAGAPVGVLPKGVQVVYATAPAELSGSMAPTMTGRHRAEFTIDLTMPDPYFYGTEQSITLNPGQTVQVWNDGNDTAINNVIVEFIPTGTFSGSGGSNTLIDPKLTNSSPNPDVSVQYKGTLGLDPVTVNVGNYTAIGGAGTNLIGNIVHVGARHFFGLTPGLNYVTFTASGSGTARLRWRPPYV